MLDLKVHLAYQKARNKAEATERRLGERCVATDLRTIFVQARARANEENRTKERLRELRREMLAESDEDMPLVTEAVANEVLGEAMVECEIQLIVPDGYKISAPPSEAALTFSNPVSEESQALVGMHIVRKWEGSGWCVGVIASANTDARRSIAGSKINFFVQYEGETDALAHVLQLADYATVDDAEYESWLLLEKVEIGG